MSDGYQQIIDDFCEQKRRDGLSDREVLEEFVTDNDELERLESLADEFNIFEAIGMARQEIRHSYFLNFLLDPNESHGLGDFFLKRLLQSVLRTADKASLPISLIDLDVWDLDTATVQREWRNIDLLITDKNFRLAVIIENKVDSEEHSNQLQRYWEIVEKTHPGWRILGLFLTPEGNTPSDERYLPISYATIAGILERIAETRSTVIGSEVGLLLRHYVKMLRRHIVSGSEIDELCLRLYQRHKRALDLIFERRPDRQKEIHQKIIDLIKKTPDLVLDKQNKVNIHFAPAWKGSILQDEQAEAAKWSENGFVLMFYFENNQNGVTLNLQIGPGHANTRERLFQTAKKFHGIFKCQNKLGPFCRIYNRPIIKKEALETVSMEEIAHQLHTEWDAFLKNDLTKIQQALAEEKFFSSQGSGPD